MYATKEAMLLKEHVPEIDVTIFYMDVRAYGKGFEEFYQRAKQEFGIKYIRGRVAEIVEESHMQNLFLKTENTETGEILEYEADMVVLSAGLVSPRNGNFKKILPIPVGDDGFFVVSNPKSDPATTKMEGVFIAGAAEGPKDIPDTVIQASAAAMKASIFLKE